MENKEQTNRPQVLLLGNGINRCFAGNSWDNVVQSIWQNPRIPYDKDEIQRIPYPLQIVLATNDSVDQTLKNTQPFQTICNNQELVDSCQAILRIGFDHILTTNYTYELEYSAVSHVRNIEDYVKRHIQHTDAVDRAEGKYMLHTYNHVNIDGIENKIWHIHGEARKYDSIVLGHYYYGNLLKRYQLELDDRGNKQQEHQGEGKPPIMDSWIDAFIMGDVYVMGFGYDFSEMDMWWLLNRKQRENAIHGKVYFYEPSYDKKVKHALLETYGATVLDLGFSQSDPDYKAFYMSAIKDIQAKIKVHDASYNTQ